MKLSNFLLLMNGGGVAVPVNTVAPAINASAVIGTQITGDDGTWTGSPTFTYQWQRNTGSFVNIGSATSKNYIPVDADFGYALRLVVTPNSGVAANSNSTNLTREAPVQTLGSELLTNGSFASWTTDNPNGWTIGGESGSDPMVTQVDPSGGAGTGAARFVSSASNSLPSASQAALTTGQYLEVSAAITALVSGGLTLLDTSSGFQANFASIGNKHILGRPASTTFRIRGLTAPIDVTMDSVGVKPITPNVQLTAPSADMRMTQFFTLPVTPLEGDSLWVMPRISNFANGNYWLAFLTYTGSQWNITLFSVAAFVRTSRATATNIGTTNGLRINLNGTSIILETTADGGSNWTQRGTTVTNSTYQTATGVNTIANSTFTLNNMVYEAAV